MSPYAPPDSMARFQVYHKKKVRQGTGKVCPRSPGGCGYLAVPWCGRCGGGDQHWRSVADGGHTLEMDGFTVIVVQSHDLHDPAIMIQHLKNFARAIGMAELV